MLRSGCADMGAMKKIRPRVDGSGSEGHQLRKARPLLMRM